MKIGVSRRINCLFLMLPILLFPVDGYTKTAYVNESSINIRSGPGIDYKVISVVRKDEPLTVIEETNNKWTEITTGDGKNGWISTKMITYEKPLQEILSEYSETIERQNNQINSLSKDFLKTRQENKKFKTELDRLRIKEKELLKENRKLKSSKDILYMGAAGLAFLIIWTMGFIAGNFRVIKENKRFKDMTASVHKELKTASLN